MPRRTNKQPRTPQPARRKFSRERGVIQPKLTALLVLLLLALGGVALNRQAIYDWWQLRGYAAPSPVSALAEQDTMTPYGRKVFYVNHPSLDDKTAFNRLCPNSSKEQTIVLGCYHGDQTGIFVLSVNDPRLDGVEQVTAAHEMLHAAYDRLGSADKEKVNKMLQDYYDHDLHDQRIIDTINAYRKSEPNDVINEMHSIFGTEIAALPTGLETYYKRYFNDRSKVAGYAATYQSAFTSREATLKSLAGELGSLKQQIEAGKSDLDAKASRINEEQKRILALRSSDVAAYNAAVPGYNALIDAYNAEVAAVNQKLDRYEQLRQQYNSLVLEQNDLVNELKSPTPINR